MSQRTILEINHDCMRPHDLHELIDLFNQLGSSTVTTLLNKAEGKPLQWSSGIRVLAQRHHSEDLTVKIGARGLVREVKA